MNKAERKNTIKCFFVFFLHILLDLFIYVWIKLTSQHRPTSTLMTDPCYNENSVQKAYKAGKASVQPVDSQSLIKICVSIDVLSYNSKRPK